MSLMQLLVAGRSLKTVKDQPSPYKMKQANLLPKFAGKKAEAHQEGQPKGAPGDQVEGVAAATELCRNRGPSAAITPPEINGEHATGTCADFPQPVIQVGVKQPVLAGWYAFRKRLQRSRSSKVTPVQTELSLDTCSIGKGYSYSSRMGFLPENQMSLRPALCGSVFPPTVVGLRSFVYHTPQCWLVVIFRFPVLRQKRGCYTQCLNFLFQPRLFNLFLSQNCVNVLHGQAPPKKWCGNCIGK